MKDQKIKPFHWVIFIAILLFLLFGESLINNLIK
jgi:hypothetical protein